MPESSVVVADDRAVVGMKQRIDTVDRIQLPGDYVACLGRNSANDYGKQSAEHVPAHQGSSRG